MKDKTNLIAFPTVPRELRLLERAKIVAKNFTDSEYGIELIDLILINMQNSMSNDSWESDQFCARISEARGFLEYFKEDYNENE